MAALTALPGVRVAVWDSLGLVPVADVVAAEDVPPFANSAMDGFAVLAADTATVPAVLRVIADVAAGHISQASVTPGTAIKIMTGAPVPDGADAVVKVEDTEILDGQVRTLVHVPVGTNLRAAGGDVSLGDVVVRAGVRLGPQHMGVLAAVGASIVEVHRRPCVALLSTGDEIQPPETPHLRPGLIRDANRPLLVGLLAELGVEVRDFGIVPDDAARLRSTLERAAADCDAIFTSGGVSMGDYDLVKQVLSELGAIEFWKVAMKPGKPFAFGNIAGTPLFGLPGNPVSALVVFEQLARPALLKMMGSERVFRPVLNGVAAERMVTDPAKTVFLRARVHFDAGRFMVEESGGQGSNILSAAAAADGFAVIPAGIGTIEAGSEVSIEMFRWPESRTHEEARHE